LYNLYVNCREEGPLSILATTLANGSLFAVFRSENTNDPLCSTVSNDEGKI
jgi:hypothetical protein